MAYHRTKSLAAEMRLMMAYFAAFDGTRTWDDIEPVVDATFHPDLIVKEGKESYDLAAFKAKLQAFVLAGGSMEILKLKQQPLGIHYHLTFHKPSVGGDDHKSKDMNFTTKSFGTFQDGKLIRVQRDYVRKANVIL